ncbi:YceI family protein [Leptospira terpstrae]|uniref:YceI family protein n=1 Tax=Leptospira terpstrae TaxID=293075 RepID=UPI003D05CF5A
MISTQAKLGVFLSLITVSNLFAEKKTNDLVVKEANVKFLSEAPQESIQGMVSKVEGFANLETKKILIQVDLRALKVPNRMMNNHMHENYLETEIHPITSFTGAITKWDLKSKQVVIEGEITLHGVTKKNIKIQGNIEEREKEYSIRADFEILLSDFNIEIPKLVILKLNEKIQIQTEIVWQSQK